MQLMQLQQPLPETLRLSPTAVLCLSYTKRRFPRATVRVLSGVNQKANIPESTSSWSPFGWELKRKYDSKYAKIGKHTAHYLTAGNGTTVILMIASQVVLARSYRSTMNALSRDHTVFCLELPGCGRSDSVKEPFTHQQYAAWIVKFLDHIQVTSAVVIGHSCSTAPAVALAESHASFVSHLVLVSAIGAIVSQSSCSLICFIAYMQAITVHPAL